jgi:hypothetical protein
MEMNMIVRHPPGIGLLVAIGLSALTSLGCASAPLRTEGSASAIRAAEEVGADGVPRAALHLQLARENLDKASRLHKDGQKKEAESMLMRAEADAELAVALSREEGERREAAKAMDKVRQLRSDNPESE